MEIELLTMFYGLANFGVPCLKDFVKANFWHGTAKVLSSSSFLFHFSILTFEGSMDHDPYVHFGPNADSQTQAVFELHLK